MNQKRRLHLRPEFALSVFLLLLFSTASLSLGYAGDVENFLDASVRVPLLAKASSIEIGGRGRATNYRFRRNNETIACFVEAGSGVARYDVLFQRGELLVMSEHGNDQGVVNRMYSIQPLTTRSTVQPGDAVPGGADFPPAGCFDGYFLGKYFELGETIVSNEEAGSFVFQCFTPYGEAKVRVDQETGLLPIFLEINKLADHFTTGGRRLSEVLLVAGEPSSALSRKNIVLDNVKIKQTHEGGFIQSCDVTTTLVPISGSEVILKNHWKIDSIDFAPEFESGTIKPLLPVKQGDEFVAEGIEQLPYIWSSSKSWAVPMIADLTPQRAYHRKYAVFGILAILVGVAAMLLMRRKHVN